MLALGLGEQAGLWAGHARQNGGMVPIDALQIVGPGMLDSSIARNGPSDAVPVRYSRLAGATGLHTYRRLRTLRAGVVGCSRTGSLVAVTLARLGVQKLVLVDPDVVEEHNLDAMDGATANDLGRPKVAAVAQAARLVAPACRVVAVPHLVTHPRALWHLADCDIVFCCVDNVLARHETALVAQAYLIPLLDVGTGVFHVGPNSETGARQLGADVLLCLPGEACSRCMTREEAPPTDRLRPWHHQRAGSLRTINQIAAHIAVQQLLDLLAGRAERSRWLRFEFDPSGVPLAHRVTEGETSHGCPICANAGMGDSALYWIPPGGATLQSPLSTSNCGPS
ncbi:MAG: ThiF family adenylyltransferase [Armatimonadetes bacterium]|nr:ThiF family adenylyltransferase [Armatimonadota bacterium]